MTIESQAPLDRAAQGSEVDLYAAEFYRRRRMFCISRKPAEKEIRPCQRRRQRCVAAAAEYKFVS